MARAEGPCQMYRAETRSEMPSGRVRWFDANKGYGFIINEEGDDVFMSASALPKGVTTLR